ncbi:hypothetical protein ACFLYA_02370 [Candidatus Dependentiae bacterium]
MVKIKKIFLAALIAPILSLHITSFTKIDTKTDQEVWINVFFHGIVSITPLLSLNTMMLIRSNNIEHSVYESYVKNVRNNDFFNANQPKQQYGLKKIDTTRTDANDGSPAIAKLFDLQYAWIDPKKKIKNYYYTFGWSGFINSKKMYDDAKILNQEFSREIQKFHAKGIYPKTRFIGYSHGGSLCLSLASYLQKEELKRTFSIDELILLGMPIMSDKDTLIHDPIFKKIFHFYSCADRVQALDFSHPDRFFSRKKFKKRKGFELPDKLTQVKLDIFKHINRSSGWGFNKKPIQKKCPFKRHAKSIRKCSPGHCEWWFFGWTSKYYRDDFPIAPLSIASLIPSITTHLHDHTFGNHINVQLKPFDETITIRGENGKKTTPFLTEKQLTALKDTARQFPFTKTRREAYKEKVEIELENAKTEVARYHEENPPIKKIRKHRKRMM